MVVVGGGLLDFSVSLVLFNFDFGTLGLRTTASQLFRFYPVLDLGWVFGFLLINLLFWIC